MYLVCISNQLLALLSERVHETDAKVHEVGVVDSALVILPDSHNLRSQAIRHQTGEGKS